MIIILIVFFRCNRRHYNRHRYALIRMYFDFLMIVSISTYLRILESEFMTRTGFLVMRTLCWRYITFAIQIHIRTWQWARARAASIHYYHRNVSQKSWSFRNSFAFATVYFWCFGPINKLFEYAKWLQSERERESAGVRAYKIKRNQIRSAIFNVIWNCRFDGLKRPSVKWVKVLTVNGFYFN